MSQIQVPHSSTTTKQQIHHAAREAGFDLCGITTPTLPRKYYKRYEEWLQHKFHATMEYMERSKKRRMKPGLVLPGVQSVIVLAVNYFQKDTPAPSSQHLRIAKYARGEDYHSVIEDYSATLIQRLQQFFPDEQWKPAVDYGHVLERAYAEQAGIGFIGKNGNIITRDYGSYVFLATIFTTLKITPDKPAGTRLGKCGTCTRCLDACPTSAITKPGMIDSNKCISFWTIENKTDTIPSTIANNTNGYGYGCDACQLVCPHNIRAQQHRHKRLRSENGVGEFLPLDASSYTTSAKLKNKFESSPLTRAKISGIERNITTITQNTNRNQVKQNIED